jgi:signal peptidase I
MRLSRVATLILMMLASGACSSASGLTAESTCADYLRTPTDSRHAAAIRVSNDLHAYSAGNPMWGKGLDLECGTAPDTTLRTYFAAQLALSVPSVSMEHTLNVDDTVLVNTLAYAHGAPKRGEVVLFTAPPAWRSSQAEERFVKRVVGIGGDHVVCCDSQHRLVLNGQSLDEPYLYPSDPASLDAVDIVVPAGRLWVLGDHRSRSGDSMERYARTHDIETATIPVGALVGRAFAVTDSRDHGEVRWLTIPSTYAAIPDRGR